MIHNTLKPKVAVIFCTWKRVYRLNKTLDNILSQTYKNFDIFIWNNNIKEKTTIDDILKTYDEEINIHHSSENVGGIGRFYYAHVISKNYDKVIFIDDDQILGNDVFSKMVDEHREKSILSWWGWNLNGRYWEKRDRIKNFSHVDYCGTGGMILDSSLFEHLNLYSIPEKYKFIEDLWLSYIAKYEHNYLLMGGDFDIEIENDGNDQYTELVDLKEEFFKYLNEKYK